jgi:hypothetical protein
VLSVSLIHVEYQILPRNLKILGVVLQSIYLCFDHELVDFLLFQQLQEKTGFFEGNQIGTRNIVREFLGSRK